MKDKTDGDQNKNKGMMNSKFNVLNKLENKNSIQ